MRDYDSQASRYDESHGGEERAEAAARAVDVLLDPASSTVVDLGGGTGIVSHRLRRPERAVIVLDLSSGMLTRAQRRLPGRVVRADGTALPLKDSSVDAVVCVWMLHLLSPAMVTELISQVARVIRPGGLFVTTVDKASAVNDGSDVADLLAPLRSGVASDHSADLLDTTRSLGLHPVDSVVFTGHGQGRSPAAVADSLSERYPGRTQLTRPIAASLRRLPLPHTPRPDPVYRLRSYRKNDEP
ncbi:methyltransferase family protein [Stackebrandtia endophytica]|uniref:Methyltransferase family protein n=1 Tax=Stackebrandtia endophytica TaxID=1496996 RepID=A0A543APR3_9ACTN|nr:class I SAM-dependent methyltransferase [Stackebrandtia endophytica]TQL74568.1 methyltransferase family protein [Stackebrandtia endophytica]